MPPSTDYPAGFRDLERRSKGSKLTREPSDTVIRGRQRLSIKGKNRNSPDYQNALSSASMPSWEDQFLFRSRDVDETRAFRSLRTAVRSDRIGPGARWVRGRASTTARRGASAGCQPLTITDTNRRAAAGSPTGFRQSVCGIRPRTGPYG